MKKTLIWFLVAMAALLLPGVARAAQPQAFKQCLNGSLATCYTKPEMAQFANLAVDSVNKYMDTLGAQGSIRPTAIKLIKSRQKVTDGCEGFSRNGVADAMSYFYCPVDNSIYLGLNQVWDFYSQSGPAAPLIGIAHEYGHLLQHSVGVPEPTTYAESIAIENQADCFAGTFAHYLNKARTMSKTDIKDLVGFFFSIGSAEGPGRDHGTPGERGHAFLVGSAGNLKACNTYVPDHPISK